MLEMRKTAVSLDERDLMNLERIITDADEKESLLSLSPRLPLAWETAKRLTPGFRSLRKTLSQGATVFGGKVKPSLP